MSLTAPGVGLTAAVPPDGYARISSTSTSSGIVAGVAALILSRFPHLTAAQVAQALTRGTTTAGRAPRHRARHHRRRPGGRPGGRPSASPRSPASRPAPARPHKPERLSTTAAHGASASNLAGSLVRYVVAGLCVLIVLLVGLLLVMRSRRERARAAAARGRAGPRARARGQHEQRRPELVPGPDRSPPGPAGSPGSLAASPPGLAPPGPADHGRLGRRRRLAGRQRGRDRALLRRAVPPGHNAAAEGR